MDYPPPTKRLHGYTPINSQQITVDAISVIDVDVVPSTLGGKVVYVQLNRPVDCAVNEPGALHVDRVVADPVGDDAFRLRQPGVVKYQSVDSRDRFSQI